ncbi:flagellar biosynthesis protein, partial [Escherichia coli 5905]
CSTPPPGLCLCWRWCRECRPCRFCCSAPCWVLPAGG